jgi:hypothetical protein
MYRSTYILTSALDGEWSASRPSRFTSGGKVPRYTLDRRLGGPQNLSGKVEKRKICSLPELEIRPLGCPARTMSLYWPIYPGSISWYSVPFFVWRLTAWMMFIYIIRTPWSLVLQKLIVTQLLKELYLAFYRTWRFISIFKRARH